MEYLQKSVGIVKKIYKEYEKKQPDNINSFKQKHPFEKRKLESENQIKTDEK